MAALVGVSGTSYIYTALRWVKEHPVPSVTLPLFTAVGTYYGGAVNYLPVILLPVVWYNTVTQEDRISQLLQRHQEQQDALEKNLTVIKPSNDQFRRTREELEIQARIVNEESRLMTIGLQVPRTSTLIPALRPMPFLRRIVAEFDRRQAGTMTPQEQEAQNRATIESNRSYDRESIARFREIVADYDNHPSSPTPHHIVQLRALIHDFDQFHTTTS